MGCSDGSFRPDEAELAGRLLGDPDLDSDLDGLTDYEETLLGTDTLTDRQEVEGFFYNGQQWHANPLEIDTNFDRLDDSREWLNTDLFQTTWDTDGTPDLFDDDNDDDQVPDRFDISPFDRYDTDFSDGNPFSLIVNGLTPVSPPLSSFKSAPPIQTTSGTR